MALATSMRSALRAAAGRHAAATAVKTGLYGSGSVLGARAFSGNVEYPRIEGSVADITKAVNTIGARLSIPTAALYLTEAKINHIVREMKGKDELLAVQRSLLLCDAKLVFPSQFAAGTFVAACLKLDAPEVAVEFVQKAENARRYMNSQSFVRLATYFAEHDDQAAVEDIWALMKAKGVSQTTKAYHSRVVNAKNQGKFDEAVAIAREAANERQINSNLIIQLLAGLEGPALQEQIPLAKYLAAKGEVFVNARLSELLATSSQ